MHCQPPSNKLISHMTLNMRTSLTHKLNVSNLQTSISSNDMDTCTHIERSDLIHWMCASHHDVLFYDDKSFLLYVLIYYDKFLQVQFASSTSLIIKFTHIIAESILL